MCVVVPWQQAGAPPCSSSYGRGVTLCYSNAAPPLVFSEGRGVHGGPHPPLLPTRPCHSPLSSHPGLFGFTWDPLHPKLNLPIWDRETQDWSACFFLSVVTAFVP